jgi:hypothetical protein
MIKRRQIIAKYNQWIAAHVAAFIFDKKEKIFIIYFMVDNSAASKSLTCRKNSKTSWRKYQNLVHIIVLYTLQLVIQMIKRRRIIAKSSQWIAAHVAVFIFDKNEKNILYTLWLAT